MHYFLNLLLYILGASIQSATALPVVPGAQCDRICVPGQYFECVYYLTLAKFYTLAPNCLACESGNYDNCRLPLCVPGDGNPRSVKTFNNSLPGPNITACQGDDITVYLTCTMDPETCSIHWHGMHQTQSQSADGVPMVTQWPVLPNEVFTYKFPASEAGTHFYHSHSGSQRADGAYGHLIIRKPAANETYASLYKVREQEHTLSLLEFFPQMSDEWLIRYQWTSLFYDQDISSILVNGQAQRANSRIPPYKIRVKQGLGYRIRVIHAGNIVCPMEMSIDNHVMNVFNSDGNDFKNVTVDRLTLTNGERFDFILNANQSPNRYTIRFQGSLVCGNVTGTAILEYENFSTSRYTPTVGNRRLNCVTNRADPNCISLTSLIALTDLGYKSKVDYSYLVTFNQELYARPRFRPQLRSAELYSPFMNNIAHVPPTKPTLTYTPASTDICNWEAPKNCNSTRNLCECTHVITFSAGMTVDMVYADLGTNLELAHPIHVHGHSMQVLVVEDLGNATTRQAIISRYQSISRSFPIMKDTIAVPDGGYVIVRMLLTKGSWLIHCHVDFHTEEGMQYIMQVV